MNEFMLKKVTDAQVAIANRKDETGAAGVEYGILVAAIAAGIVVAAFLIGDKIGAAFDLVENAIP